MTPFFPMKNFFVALAVAVLGTTVYAGEKTQVPAPVAVKPAAVKAPECTTCAPKTVSVVRRATLAERRSLVVVEPVKVVEVKEVKAATAACTCATATPVTNVTSRVRGRLLGARNRVASVVECANCK